MECQLRCESEPQVLELRKVASSDLRLLHRLYNESFSIPGRGPREDYDYWHRLMTRVGVVSRGVWWAGERVGAVVLFREKMGWEITYWLAREVRGQGLGSRAVEAFLKVTERRPVWARVREENEVSAKLLIGRGFELVERRQSYCEYREQSQTELLFRLDGQARVLE